MKKLAALLLALVMLLSAVALAEMPLPGGWNVAESAEITDELQTVFDKAMEGLVGVDYEPIAYLGYQVVAGRNHCYLCRATVVYPNAVPTLTLVYIYEGLNGGVEITNIAELDLAALATPAETAE